MRPPCVPSYFTTSLPFSMVRKNEVAAFMLFVLHFLDDAAERAVVAFECPAYALLVHLDLLWEPATATGAAREVVASVAHVAPCAAFDALDGRVLAHIHDLVIASDYSELAPLECGAGL